MSERGVRVICPDCADLVAHTCNSQLKEAITDLMSWVPERGLGTEALEEALIASGKEHGWIEEGEEKAHEDSPFFGSQGWSYPLFGSKGEARTFHALIHNLIRATGIDPHDIQVEVHQRMEAEKERKAEAKKNREEREARVTAKQKARDEVSAFLQGEAPLDERIAKLDVILKDRAKSLDPENDSEHNGYGHLHKYLKRYYKGGIDHRINHARIEKLRRDAINFQVAGTQPLPGV